MQMHRLELFVIEFDNQSTSDLITRIKQDAVDNGIVVVGNVETADIGEFHDEHVLNQTSTPVEIYRQYFDK